jgi:hypothetical protein
MAREGKAQVPEKSQQTSLEEPQQAVCEETQETPSEPSQETPLKESEEASTENESESSGCDVPDSHKWDNKMEVQRLLSGKPDLEIKYTPEATDCTEQPKPPAKKKGST